jgi:hypothetical protein
MRKISAGLSLLILTLAIASGTAIAKKRKGAKLTAFPESPSVETLFIKEKIKKVKKTDKICVGGFQTSFVQNTVVQIRAKGAGRKRRRAAGRRLVNVKKETRQAITDDAYAYARAALAKAGFEVLSPEACSALKKWDKLKVTKEANGELSKLGIFAGVMKAPTGATHASRHTATGVPAYRTFGASQLGDVKNNAVGAIKIAAKNKVGMVDFGFALDFNVNSAEMSITSKDSGVNEITITTKWSFDFRDALFVSASGMNFVNPKYKTGMWFTGPQYGNTFPAYLDNSYITGAVENQERWTKGINAANFDIEVDQAKYKEIYGKTLQAYIDVYVGRLAGLKSL